MTSVSIIIPAFNHARFLSEAIESVLSQTYSSTELIVLDDGSTDETGSILARYGHQFHWESQTNMGQAATLNKGGAMAQGEILGYLSADDVLYPKAVARAVATLNADTGLVAVYPDFEQIDEASRVLSIVHTPEFDYAEMVLRATCPPGPGAFFRRSAYEAAGGWDVTLRRIPDFEFWLRLGLIGRFRRIPEVLANYRVHDKAQSFSAVNVSQADEIVRVIDALLENPNLSSKIREKANMARANARLHAARMHLLSRRTVRGMQAAVSALAIDPWVLVRPSSFRLLASGVLWGFRAAK